MLGTALSCPQHLLSHIWQHWRDLTGIAACQMELSAPLLRALSNEANLSPPTTQQSLFTALIRPSSSYTFLIEMALNRKLIKSLQNLKHILLLLPASSSPIPDILTSRSLPARHMAHNKAPVYEVINGVLTCNKSKHNKTKWSVTENWRLDKEYRRTKFQRSIQIQAIHSVR